MNRPKILNVACALIEKDGKVLITQRQKPAELAGLWEFPGGKLHYGESARACIVREIKEELSIAIEPLVALNPANCYRQNLTICLIPYICKHISGHIVLHEHADIQWVQPTELKAIQWCPADVPIVQHYLQYINL